MLDELIGDAKSDLGSSSLEQEMYAVDQMELNGSGSAAEVRYVVSAKADEAMSADMKVGNCGILKLSRDASYTVQPIYEINFALANKNKGSTNVQLLNNDSVTVRVVSGPSHGKLIVGDTKAFKNVLNYVPDAKFEGKDTFAVQVKGKGALATVYYHVAVTGQDGYVAGEYCDPLGSWMISVDGQAKDLLASSVGWSEQSELQRILRAPTLRFAGSPQLNLGPSPYTPVATACS